MSDQKKQYKPVVVFIFAFLLLICFFYSAGMRNEKPVLVVYCAHDAMFSEKIIDLFEEKTGIPVELKTDTEATKSLGLVNLLIREEKNPRCDVFWNNQLLGTLDLYSRGLLLPYQGKELERFPDEFKASDGSWVGFGGRMRVYIVNKDKMEVSEKAVTDLLSKQPELFGVAKPMYGTTLTHYSLLWHEWGGDKLKKWHHEMREKGMKELSGNAMVKNIVASGSCYAGWTDTDDFFVAQDAGEPVEMLPIRTDDGKVICIPNTVSIIKGTKHPELAEKFVDFLLSEEVELLLANSPARQIPLGKLSNPSALSDDVSQLSEWSQNSYPLGTLSEARTECLEWLQSEYLE